MTSFSPKDPDATRRYTWDLSDWLDAGETITGYSFPDFPAGLTKETDGNTTTTVYAVISGGVDGESHDITCRFTTNAGQTDDRTITLPIAEQ